MKKLTIIVPCYNEEEVLKLFYRETKRYTAELPDAETEFLFVDDGSSDGTLQILRSLAACDSSCHYITFSRNFGKEAAMYAGLQAADGDYCVLMDADLQHPPALLPRMYAALKDEGYDCCAGRRTTRDGEGAVRNFLSHCFYRVIRRLSRMDMQDGAGDFRMMTRRMVDSVLSCTEYNRYMKGIFSFVGFETKWIPFENTARAAGRSKWSLKSLFRYAVDGIFSFSTAPISLSGAVGVLLFILSLFLAFGTAVSTLIFGNEVNGWTTIVCLILFLNGMQMLFLSVLGEYVSKNYMESKGRPVYIIKDKG